MDAVQRADTGDLRQREQALHGFLSAMVKDKPQIQSIWIIGPDGRPVATSRFFPTPALNFSDRDYFKFHQGGTGRRYVSELLVSRTTGEQVIDISLPRPAPDGSFGGVVSISLQTSYFQKFHGDLLADEPGLAINMLREDGAIFTRTPVLPGAPARLSPDSPVMASIRAGNKSGEMRGTSSVDGSDRLISFRKLGDYPIYLGSGMDLGEVRKTWLQEMGVLGAFGLPPLVALFFTARVALRRTRDTLETAERLTHETLTRRRAEEALLQAQKLEALGRLTGGVAHDFNNALMVISNNLFLLRRKHPDAGTKEVDSIGRAVESATKLTRQLLAFSRRQALVPEHLHLQDKLPSMRELVAPVLGSQVALSVEVAADTHAILVDAAELELALLNLAINARDAMPGGGSFRVSARNVTGAAPPLMAGPAVVVEVSDSGSGIEASLLDKVFEPFFTTKPVDQGTGLGLSQVYGLCQRAGGTATIASVVGAGTTVSLFFPAVPDAPPPGAAVAARANRQLDKSVLLVEDNDAVAGALIPVLEALGCQVVRVDRAVGARDWLAAQTLLPDLVLSDVVMPGDMDGVALGRFVRATYPALKVLLMTGHAAQMDAISQLGFDVLPKPCSAEMLSEAILRVSGAAPGKI